MEFIPTAIREVILVKPKIFADDRGFFMETYRNTEFREAGILQDFVQDNHSGSSQGTLRGLHYQIKHAQGKLVRVVAGEIFDVAVDLRRNSNSFGQWTGTNLSEVNKHQLWIPPGFAHGFYVISNWADVCYKATDIYAPDWERTLIWNDPEVGIEWPLLDHKAPSLSEKDLLGKRFQEVDAFEEP